MTRGNFRTLLLLVWLCSFPLVARTQTFLEALVGTDYASLIAASMVAMAASIVRTGLSLLGPQPVHQVLREFLRDAAYAFFAGGVVYIAVEAAREEDLWHPKRTTWLLLVGVVGVLRGWIFLWAWDLIRALSAAVVSRLTGIVKGPAP